MTPDQGMPTRSDPRPGIAITYLIKAAGILIAVHEAFTTKDPVVIGLASFMLAGAQAGANFLEGIKR